jgi:UDP-N-acetylmuramate dehydrogenase
MLREGDRLVFGAGCLNANAALFAQQQSLGGIEFLSGIPGSIGGALRMNAGAYGAETKDRLLEAEALDPNGNLHRLKVGELGYGYRACGLPEGWIFTRAVFQGICEPDESIRQRMEAIAMKRAASQPLRARTGGSTFKNPPGAKAWELIDKAGCRGLRHGEAQMSELHCNFLINTGNASASDIEELGETVRARVLASSGVALEWEIKRIGLVWRSSGALCR